jgi:hypothetical protein
MEHVPDFETPKEDKDYVRYLKNDTVKPTLLKTSAADGMFSLYLT